MTIKRVSVTPRRQYLDLCLTSDWHLGSSTLDAAALASDLDNARRRKSRLLVNGDLFDAIAASDHRYLPSCTTFHETDTPVNAAINCAVELLKPFRRRLDLIGIGNHEHKLVKVAGFDPVAETAERLGRPDAASGYCTLVVYDIKWPDNSHRRFTILAHHGTRASRASILTAFSWVDADIIWFGHHHHRVASGSLSLHLDAAGKLRSREQRRVMTGAYLNAYTESRINGRTDNYASIAGYAPGLIGGAHVIITPSTVRVEQ